MIALGDTQKVFCTAKGLSLKTCPHSVQTIFYKGCGLNTSEFFLAVVAALTERFRRKY
jgi:hypothetical protein